MFGDENFVILLNGLVKYFGKSTESKIPSFQFRFSFAPRSTILDENSSGRFAISFVKEYAYTLFSKASIRIMRSFRKYKQFKLGYTPRTVVFFFIDRFHKTYGTDGIAAMITLLSPHRLLKMFIAILLTLLLLCRNITYCIRPAHVIYHFVYSRYCYLCGTNPLIPLAREKVPQ